MHLFSVSENPEGPHLKAFGNGEAYNGRFHDAGINRGDRLPVRVACNPAADAVEARKQFLF